MELQQVTNTYFFESLYANDNNLNAIRFLRMLEKKYEDVACKNKNEFLELFSRSRWFTPNVFNLKKCGRIKKNVQYITAFTLEFDCNLPSPIDVLDRIEAAGLQAPHFLMRSKTPGHWHVYWFIQPIAAYSNIVKTFDKVIRLMAELTGADVKGAGVERWFAVPRSDIYQYAQLTNIYTFESFIDWFQINNPEASNVKKNEKVKSCKVFKTKIFGHPAIKALLSGTEVGKRDHACFTLALLYYAQNWDQEEALEELLVWNKKNEKEIKISEIKKCVKSAFSGKYKGPSSHYIQMITGIPFKMQVLREYEGDKTYQKLYDIQYRILQLIKKTGALTMSQKDISQKIEAPLRSVKKAIKELIDQKRIIKSGGGSGPGNVATYSLAITQIKPAKQAISTVKPYVVPPALPLLASNGANCLTLSFSTGPPG